MLTGEARVRQILGRGRAAHRDGDAEAILSLDPMIGRLDVRT